MTPPIAPLARRLAEENNVDWRTLQGSGDGGSIGERDVLNYLEQVMLGVKPVDPTPEPLPEGVKAWAEESAATPEAQTAPSPATGSEARDDLQSEAYRTLAETHRAALTELEALRLRIKELEQLSVKVEQLGTREAEAVVYEARIRELEAQSQTESAARRELAQARDAAQAEELARTRVLDEQVGSLRASLADSQRETQKAQETTADLSARLGEADAAKSRAEAEVESLRAAKSALEAEVAGLKSRPWWKVWG